MNRLTAALLISTLFLSGCQAAASATPPESTRTALPPTAIPPTDTPVPSDTATAIPTHTGTPFPAVDEQLSAGDQHTCLLHADGAVTCWGWNQYGQTGQAAGEIASEGIVPGLNGITHVSAGAYHTCALDRSGTVWCWGRNNDGQLGNGSDQDSTTPVKVQGFAGRLIRAISAGSMHTCAVDFQGSVWCWGSNRLGKLGQPADVFNYSTPQQVTTLTTAVEMVSAGSSHTCAVDTQHQVWCWGEGTFGQVGLDPFASSASPTLVTTLEESVITLQAGWFHTCLLTESGRVECWGKNQDGQLGNAAQISSAKPVSPVKMDANVSLVASGGQMNCTVKTDQTTSCWGRNNYGQVGDQTSIDRLIPVPVKHPAPLKQIAIGGSHACALSETGQVVCWGANDLGQLGLYEINPIPTSTPTARVATRQP